MTKKLAPSSAARLPLRLLQFSLLFSIQKWRSFRRDRLAISEVHNNNKKFVCGYKKKTAKKASMAKNCYEKLKNFLSIKLRDVIIFIKYNFCTLLIFRAVAVPYSANCCQTWNPTYITIWNITQAHFFSADKMSETIVKREDDESACVEFRLNHQAWILKDQF